MKVTHQELMALYPTDGIRPSDCPGEVQAVTVIRDPDPLTGPDATIEVQVYRCRQCGTHVSIDATHRRVLNTYRFTDVQVQVRDLARAFHLPGGEAPPGP